MQQMLLVGFIMGALRWLGSRLETDIVARLAERSTDRASV
jgi:hypothetical protein